VLLAGLLCAKLLEAEVCTGTKIKAIALTGLEGKETNKKPYHLVKLVT